MILFKYNTSVLSKLLVYKEMVNIVNNKEYPKERGIQTLERSILILDEIKKNMEPLTLTELSKKVNMSKNHLKKYLVSFVKTSTLTFDEETKTYDLGSKLIDLGLNALNRFSILSIIEPFMQQIKNDIQQSSALAIWTDRGPMITKYQNSGRSINVEIEVGYYPPLLGSAIGKCFVAFLPLQFTENLQEKELADYNFNKDLVTEELNRIKETGVSSRDHYFGDLPGSCSVACPIFDYSGEMIAAICIIGFSNDLDTRTQSDDVQILKKIAMQVSKRLAYQA